jgi:hypothetical protein
MADIIDPAGFDKLSIIKTDKLPEGVVISIWCPEFLDDLANIISNTNTKLNNLEADKISDEFVLYIDQQAYDSLSKFGDKTDIDAVLTYIATAALNPNRFTNQPQFMSTLKDIAAAFDNLKSLPLENFIRKDKAYKKILTLAPCLYLSSIVNIEDIVAMISELDKSPEDERYMTNIAQELSGFTKLGKENISAAYKIVKEYTIDILNDLNTYNSININNDIKRIEGFAADPKTKSYYSDLVSVLKEDLKTNFDGLKKKLDKALEKIEETEVDPTPVDGVAAEGHRIKRLKRIAPDIAGYVRIQGANARDAETLTMIVSYGYSYIERCDWYMSLIEDNDPNYIIPQNTAELRRIRDNIQREIDILLKDPRVDRQWKLRVNDPWIQDTRYTSESALGVVAGIAIGAIVIPMLVMGGAVIAANIYASKKKRDQKKIQKRNASKENAAKYMPLLKKPYALSGKKLIIDGTVVDAFMHTNLDMMQDKEFESYWRFSRYITCMVSPSYRYGTSCKKVSSEYQSSPVESPDDKFSLVGQRIVAMCKEFDGNRDVNICTILGAYGVVYMPESDDDERYDTLDEFLDYQDIDSTKEVHRGVLYNHDWGYSERSSVLMAFTISGEGEGDDYIIIRHNNSVAPDVSHAFVSDLTNGQPNVISTYSTKNKIADVVKRAISKMRADKSKFDKDKYDLTLTVYKMYLDGITSAQKIIEAESGENLLKYMRASAVEGEVVI